MTGSSPTLPVALFVVVSIASLALPRALGALNPDYTWMVAPPDLTKVTLILLPTISAGSESPTLGTLGVSNDENSHGVDVGLGISMAAKDLNSLRRVLQAAVIKAINDYCNEVDNYAACCGSSTPPLRSYSDFRAYVTAETLLSVGASRDERSGTIFVRMNLQPDISTNDLCNPLEGRHERLDYRMTSDTVAALASSSGLGNAIATACASAGLDVTIAQPSRSPAARLRRGASSNSSNVTPSGANITNRYASSNFTTTSDGLNGEMRFMLLGIGVGTGVGVLFGIGVIIAVCWAVKKDKERARRGY